MWRSLTRFVRTTGTSVTVLSKRTFLSEAYRCREAWGKRLESPILKKVNVVTMFQELDGQFSYFGRANATDVDVFVNANTSARFIDDVEDIILKLRRSEDTGDTLPSTHYAVIRLFLDHGKTDNILKIVSDRLKFGIYPSHYCCNILMDTFLKQKNYAAAARIGVLQMLQEDWKNPLTTRLAVYSCHIFLRNPDQTWYTDGEVKEPVPQPKEVVKVRVRHIRRPFFDDHFDLQDPKMLVGKTLSMFSSKIGGDEALAVSYKILGLILHQKWNQATEIVDSLFAQKIPVYKEAIALARQSLVKVPQETAEGEAQAPKPTGKVDPAAEAAKAKAEAEKKNEELMKQKTDEALARLEVIALNEDLLEAMGNLVKESVSLQESKEIEEQKQLFIQWEEDRISALKRNREAIRQKERLEAIEKEKQQLTEEEREIYFFDNEDAIDLRIEEREEEMAKQELNATATKITKQTKSEEDLNYVPPEIVKRRPRPS